MSQRELRDVDLIEDVVEDIEKRRHCRNPFDNRFVNFALSRFHGDSIESANKSVNLRSELISQMQRDLLKKVESASLGLQKSRVSKRSSRAAPSAPDTRECAKRGSLEIRRTGCYELYHHQQKKQACDSPESFERTTAADIFGSYSKSNLLSDSTSMIRQSGRYQSFSRLWSDFGDPSSKVYFLNVFKADFGSSFVLSNGSESDKLESEANEGAEVEEEGEGTRIVRSENLNSVRSLFDEGRFGTELPVLPLMSRDAFDEVLRSECSPLQSQDDDVEMQDYDEDCGGGDEIQLDLELTESGNYGSSSDSDSEDDDLLDDFASTVRGGTSKKVMRQIRLEDMRAFGRRQQKIANRHKRDRLTSNEDEIDNFDEEDDRPLLVLRGTPFDKVGKQEGTAETSGSKSGPQDLLFDMGARVSLPRKKKEPRGSKRPIVRKLKLSSAAESNLLPLVPSVPRSRRLRTNVPESKSALASSFFAKIGKMDARSQSFPFDGCLACPELGNLSELRSRIRDSFSLQPFVPNGGTFDGCVYETIPCRDDEEFDDRALFGDEGPDIDQEEDVGGGDEIRLEDVETPQEGFSLADVFSSPASDRTNSFGSTPNRDDFLDNANPEGSSGFDFDPAVAEPRRKIPRFEIDSFFRSARGEVSASSRQSTSRTARLISKILAKGVRRQQRSFVVNYSDEIEKRLQDRIGVEKQRVFVGLLHAANKMNSSWGGSDAMDVDGEMRPTLAITNSPNGRLIVEVRMT